MTLADQLRQEGLEKGMEKGMERGRQESLRESILEVLAIRFGEAPPEVREALAGIDDIDRLRKLHTACIQAGSLEEFGNSL